jgi:sensor histidine kinase regulating citrate/malate metabolism
MKNYTTWDAIGDMFIIYFIVIVISMLVAAIIRGIVVLLSRQAAHAEAKAPPKPVAAAPSVQPVVAGIPQEHIAAISAAVAMMMGAHRIVHIEMAGRGFGWTSEARASHHTSHAPRASH